MAAPPSPPEDQTGELGSHLASRCGLASVSALQLAAAWMQSACGAAVLCWVAPGHLQCGVGYAELLHLMPSKRSPEKAFIPIRLTCELLLLFVQACGNASQTPPVFYNPHLFRQSLEAAGVYSVAGVEWKAGAALPREHVNR